MAISFVIAQSAGGNPSTVTTAAVDTTGANLLLMVVTGFNPPTATPTDSKSNTWTATTAVGSTRFYYVWNATVGSGHTFTWNENVFAGITVLAFSGVQTSSDPLDTRTGNSSGTSPGSITPAVSGEVFIATVGGDSTPYDSTTELSTPAFTLPTNGRVNYVSGQTETAQGWYFINTDSTSRNASFSTGGWCNMIAFKPATGGGLAAVKMPNLNVGQAGKRASYF